MHRLLSLIFCCLFSLQLNAELNSRAEPLAPNFELPALGDARMHALEDYRGKVIYLDFWASWCGPCRQSLPALNEFQAQMGNKEFEVVAINLDANPADGLAFLEQFPVAYTVLSDPIGKSSRLYDLVGLPTSVLIDQHGVLVSSFQGFHPSHLVKLRKAVEILTESSPQKVLER